MNARQTSYMIGLLIVAAFAFTWPVPAAELSAVADQSRQNHAAEALLRRVLPSHAERFVLETMPADEGMDVFEIESSGGKTILRGSSGVAIASALGWYLKHYCHCDLSWISRFGTSHGSRHATEPGLAPKRLICSMCGEQMRLPEPLPTLDEKVRRTTPHRYRYFFNYCTFSYSMAWWDWPEWERMIDWMALNGINMPLAITGQEAVWQSFLRKEGMSDEEIAKFMVGPAYLPFGWMGCVDGLAGPLTQSWIDRHAALQKRILERERALGMTPVLQGFTGHVPEKLKDKYPNASFRQLPDWCGFEGTWFVDPLDPLFRQLGKAFVEEQTRWFGTDHFYASDTFIEMSPPSGDPAFLADMGRAVYGAMHDADAEAVWVMQGWLFINNPEFWKPPQNKALLTSVPDGRLLVLDLRCEFDPAWKKTEAFHGNPWVFCVLQDFGDIVGLYGALEQTSENLAEAMKSSDAGRLSGIGHSMEGLGYNPVMHDFVADMTWRSEVPELGPWVDDYVHRRYGCRQPDAIAAWRELLATVYRSPWPTVTLLCVRPALSKSFGQGEKWWQPQPRLPEVWETMLRASDELGAVDTYQFDLVNLTRQAVLALDHPIYHDALAAYESKDRQGLVRAKERMMELAADLDDLLATRREFLLGRWLAAARSWGDNDDERRFYEWNARNQITLWGPHDSELHDYAHKQWSGMMRGFFAGCWERFFDQLDASLASGEPLDVAAFKADIQRWEDHWTHATEPYPTEPQGDPVAVSRRLWEKYGETLRSSEK